MYHTHKVICVCADWNRWIPKAREDWASWCYLCSSLWVCPDFANLLLLHCHDGEQGFDRCIKDCNPQCQLHGQASRGEINAFSFYIMFVTMSQLVKFCYRNVRYPIISYKLVLSAEPLPNSVPRCEWNLCAWVYHRLESVQGQNNICDISVIITLYFLSILGYWSIDLNCGICYSGSYRNRQELRQRMLRSGWWIMVTMLRPCRGQCQAPSWLSQQRVRARYGLHSLFILPCLGCFSSQLAVLVGKFCNPIFL